MKWWRRKKGWEKVTSKFCYITHFGKKKSYYSPSCILWYRVIRYSIWIIHSITLIFCSKLNKESNFFLFFFLVYRFSFKQKSIKIMEQRFFFQYEPWTLTFISTPWVHWSFLIIVVAIPDVHCENPFITHLIISFSSTYKYNNQLPFNTYLHEFPPDIRSSLKLTAFNSLQISS